MTRRHRTGSSIVLFAAIVLGGCQNDATEKPTTTASVQARGISIDVEKASRRPIDDRLALTGIIAPERQATVVSKVTGKVSALTVREGDRVRAGQAVARIDRDQVGADFNDFMAEATLTGVVARTHVDEGSPVAPGVPLVTIMQVEKVKAVAQIIERDLGRLATGQRAEVSVEAFDQPFEGKLTFISPSLDPASHMGRIEILLDNAKGRLRPGMSARLALTVGTRDQAVVVPKTAVVTRDGQSLVFVAEDTVVSARPVELGYADLSHVEIRKGVAPDELVIVRDQFILQNGTRVTPVLTAAEESRP